jgi:hypothetical protein
VGLGRQLLGCGHIHSAVVSLRRVPAWPAELYPSRKEGSAAARLGVQTVEYRNTELDIPIEQRRMSGQPSAPARLPGSRPPRRACAGARAGRMVFGAGRERLVGGLFVCLFVCLCSGRRDIPAAALGRARHVPAAAVHRIHPRPFLVAG